jgi:Zn-dependent peptidase ImmA (M78 family)
VGADALDEIAAGTPSATLEESLRNASEAAGRARHVAHIADVGVIRANVKDFGGEEAKIPWRAGREVAYRLRKFWDLGFAPVPSAKLAERLSIRTDYLLAARSNLPWAFGFAANDNRKLSFVLNRKYQPSARFDIARIIGDHLYFDTNDRWKPTTTSWTARQKFQRAFAAEFLCPSKAVEDRYRASPFPLNSLDENIDALSREYEVSPQVVRYHLLNRKLIGRNLAPDGYESESLISSV